MYYAGFSTSLILSYCSVWLISTCVCRFKVCDFRGDRCWRQGSCKAACWSSAGGVTLLLAFHLLNAWSLSKQQSVDFYCLEWVHVTLEVPYFKPFPIGIQWRLGSTCTFPWAVLMRVQPCLKADQAGRSLQALSSLLASQTADSAWEDARTLLV